MRNSFPHLRQLLRFAFIGLFCASVCYADADLVIRKAAQRASNVTVRLRAAGEFSSGVVIGKLGQILTVNHGLPAGVRLVSVTDSNGKTYEASVVERHEDLDLALLKIGGQDVPSNVAVISMAFAIPKQSVVSAGFPARTPTANTALVRLGKIDRISKDLIRSTCQLTVGDSGGGIFDLEGRLIGLNQRIGAGRSANIHATISRCFQTIPLVKFAATIDSQPAGLRRFDWQGGSTAKAKHAVPHAWETRALQVLAPRQTPSAGNESEVLCFATLWSSEIAITKLSEIRKHKSLQLRTDDGRTVAARVVQHDRGNDLAVLELQESLLMSNVLGLAETSLHQILACGKGPASLAIAGRILADSAAAKPVLGCSLAIVNNQMQIDRVSANSAAFKANLMVGDVVVKVDNSPISNFDDLALKLQSLQPGDWTIFEVRRDEQAVKCKVQMQHDAGVKLDRTDFLDGAVRAVSLRRTGFRNAIQHDGDLRPSQMGSPLLSLQGELLGINIAVRSRETVIAIPANAVRALIDRLMVD